MGCTDNGCGSECEHRMATLTLAICARNAERIIGNCLDSIQAQSVAPDEVIVALDDLSDPTAQVAEQYGATVIASNATGLYEARNAVLDACTTEYLAFTDADCELATDWVKHAKNVLDTQEDVAAGTGRHPPLGIQNLAAWLHHMWYVVETAQTGDTRHVIGGNSYFRTAALREVGGWLNLPSHSAAEDMYISQALRNAGYRIWFEEGAAAGHHYETRFKGLWKKSVMMGKDIIVMMRAAGWRGGLWYYSLAIPLVLAAFLAGLAVLPFAPRWGAAICAAPLLGSLAYFTFKFRSLSKALPRWVARWILIWPYSLGVIKGLLAPVPPSARSR